MKFAVLTIFYVYRLVFFWLNICPRHPTFGVFLSNACFSFRIFYFTRSSLFGDRKKRFRTESLPHRVRTESEAVYRYCERFRSCEQKAIKKEKYRFCKRYFPLTSIIFLTSIIRIQYRLSSPFAVMGFFYIPTRIIVRQWVYTPLFCAHSYTPGG